MKHLFRVLLLVIMIAVFPCLNVLAVGEGNINNGGGGLGAGNSSNKWTPGNEGVRITVVRVNDLAVVTEPIDLTNKKPVGLAHFGKVSKLQYKNGEVLTPSPSSYHYVNTGQTVPRIISSQSLGVANIEEIKRYFTDEQVLRGIAGVLGMDFDILINGDYKLLIEPVSYLTYEGVFFGMTATEAALYDEVTNGGLRSKLPTVGFQNLPLAMFLEISDLGYPAWDGPRSGIRSNQEIKSSLGLGIIQFKEREAESPEIISYDYEYRVNTEVISAVRVSGGQSDPDHPTRVKFYIGGRSYQVDNVYYPDGDSQIVWVKWTTPATEQNMTITVTVSGLGNATKGTIHAKIVDLGKNPPPNPVADDRNDSFSPASVPNRPVKTFASWSVWRPWWQEYWVWHDGDDDDGYWCDHGWWEFDLDSYQANLSSSMSIKCDSKNPTSSGRTMKSGYGINQTVTGSVSSNQSLAVTQPQNAVSYFPEFGYKTYWRLLERTGSGRFEFQKNNYSAYKNRTHFSPIWMPDGVYTVNTWLLDAWTPEGMLSANLTDSLTIRGDLWEDWHISPKKP
ncbi:hypothetical protein [Lacrimispora sp.]|uniref:hypothetical protein n=1 Tax=Lacrimispora sp. TaxID=2719234 RepID=UPI0028AAB68D|nr:hypothetical protein [Lacrimispora sp.]